jgi:hypothetical protein
VSFLRHPLRRLRDALIRPGADVTSDTAARRTRRYEQRAKNATWFAAGVLGFIALTTSSMSESLLDDAPRIIKVLMLLLVIVSVLCPFFARTGFEWERRQLIGDGSEAAPTPAGVFDPEVWPKGSEAAYTLGEWALGGAGLLFVVGCSGRTTGRQFGKFLLSTRVAKMA